jgi:hypothetical protein
MIYADTNYTTWCRYLCNSLHCVKNPACCSLVDASPGWSIITLSFEHKILQLQAYIPSQCERLIDLVGCYYDPIFMADPKNMASTCMRLYRSKNYGKIHAWVKHVPLHVRKFRKDMCDDFYFKCFISSINLGSLQQPCN